MTRKQLQTAFVGTLGVVASVSFVVLMVLEYWKSLYAANPLYHSSLQQVLEIYGWALMTFIVSGGILGTLAFDFVTGKIKALFMRYYNKVHPATRGMIASVVGMLTFAGSFINWSTLVNNANDNFILIEAGLLILSLIIHIYSFTQFKAVRNSK